MNRPRILLADDHALIAEGLTNLFESEFDCLEIIQDGQTLLKKIGTLKPDVLLLDISLPLLNGFDAALRIRQKCPSIKIIFLTMHTNSSFVKNAKTVGASGYIVKQSAASELTLAIREVLEGRTYYSPAVTDVRDDQASRTSPSTNSTTTIGRLTPRQREVLQLIAEGRSNKDIAASLSLSLKTVEYHKTRIMRTLNVHSIAELTKLAIANRLVPLS